MMDWHVLGVGAIGALFARRIHAMGHKVTLLSRHETGLGASQSLPFAHDKHSAQPLFDVSSIHSASPIHHLLVCTKAFSTLDAVDSIAHRLVPNAVIVLLSNGMGYHEHVATRFDAQTVLAGTTTAACYRTLDRASGGYVWHRVSEGATLIGDLRGGTIPDWFDSFVAQPWGCYWSSDVRQALLTKLAINAVINPPTAIHDIVNGELLSTHHKVEFDQAIAEVSSLLFACGEAALAESIGDHARLVVQRTAANTSSMRADIQGGRQTEIEAILGYLLEQLPRQVDPTKPPPHTPILSDWLRTVRSLEQAAQ